MLRLDYFLMRGGLLVKGDECYNPKTDESNVFDRVITDSEACAGMYDFSGDGHGIYDNEDLIDLAIESFAFRDNNGTQPVPDDFPVVISCDVDDESESKFISGNIDWWMSFFWKPDHDKLLEQQNEYDKQQAIEPKESKMSEFTYGQKIYIKDNTEHEFEFGCNFNDGKSILYMFDGGYGRTSIDSVSATPFKTELEIAKEKQIEDALQELTDTKMMKFNRLFTRTMLEIMQSKGLLAEIILPLKDK